MLSGIYLYSWEAKDESRDFSDPDSKKKNQTNRKYIFSEQHRKISGQLHNQGLGLSHSPESHLVTIQNSP